MTELPSLPDGCHELPPDQLLTRCDPRSLGFGSTAELEGHSVAMGQDRAAEALSFGLAIKQDGFNMFVLGPPGSGRSKLARAFIARRAATERVPDEFCYVHNFDDPRRPHMLQLPAGRGASLRDQMRRLIEDLVPSITSAFDNQSYRDRRDAIEREISQPQEREFESIAADAAKQDIAVVRTPSGLAIALLRDGKVLEPSEVARLPEAEHQRLRPRAEAVEAQLHEALRRVPQRQREQRERVRALDQDVTRSVVCELLGDVRRAFADLPAVLGHLDCIERDITGSASQWVPASATQEGPSSIALGGALGSEASPLRRYRINLLVDHRGSTGAPVEVLDNPTSSNLVGRTEHLSQFGVTMTDFNLIKAGALHRANGGYLMVDAHRLLGQPVAFQQLKRTLRTRQIRVESVAEALDLSIGVSQEPEAIAFSAKVILVGEPWLYALLSERDPEFDELFKVAAEFETDIERSAETCRGYAEMLALSARDERLRPLDADAVALLIEQSSRLAEDSTRLSMRVRGILDLAREADHWAAEAGRPIVQREDIERAISTRDRRHGRMRERIGAMIHDGTLHVDTAGTAVGQINGLWVATAGPIGFAFPARITARVRLGSGEVVDIEREVQQGGPIHSKGVLTLAAFLGARYQTNRPLSVRATLVFEQTYGKIEGDSASLAELLCLLSALGRLPISQGLAVTGSVDQHGRVQAIGGVNDKVEGFFSICRARGLDGTQGVIIPDTNRRHLMLGKDVVEAASRGLFHLWPVSTVDEAMQVAFRVVAGARESGDKYPEGSANYAIEAGLEQLARAALSAAREVQRPSERPHAAIEPRPQSPATDSQTWKAHEP